MVDLEAVRRLSQRYGQNYRLVHEETFQEILEEIERLRAAVLPFAQFAYRHEAGGGGVCADSHPAVPGYTMTPITVGDCRRAAVALKGGSID